MYLLFVKINLTKFKTILQHIDINIFEYINYIQIRIIGFFI